MDSSNEYTIEYIFTASVQGLEKGVDKVKSLIKNAGDAAKDFGSAMSEGAYQAIGSVNDLDGKTQALLATVTALEVALAKDSLAAFSSYEDAMFGMATTVGNVGGTIESAMGAIRDSTANGLLSQTDAARAINNLTAYGYSVSEASRLVQELTNVSMANRNETMSVSEQVERLTEGIKRGASQILKTNGLMITSSEAMAAYANSIGKTTNDLTDAERRQALFNSIVMEGQQNVAVAAAYQDSYSAATQRMNNALNDLKVAFGQVLAPMMTWVANVVTWVAKNRELVVTLAATASVIAGAGGIAVALAKLIPVVKSAVAWFIGLSSASKGLVGVLTALVGVATVYGVNKAISAMGDSMADVASSTGYAADEMVDFSEAVGGGGGGAVGAVRDLSNELEKLERQYKDELKQIEQRHQETIDRLTKQIYEANVDYRRAIDERNAEFAVSQAKEEKKHQEKVDDIMTQIAFLQRYNNDYNKQKLANLEFALAKENALYQQQTQAAKEQLDLQNEYDRQAYEEKRAQYQAELDEELAFMEKHRADLQEVRGWILKDEIEALKERYEEQKAAYAEQAAGALSGGSGVGSNFLSGMKDALAEGTPEIKAAYTSLADEVGQSWQTKLMDWVAKAIEWIINSIKEVWNWIARLPEHIENMGNNIAQGLDNFFSGMQRRFSTAGDVLKTFFNPGFATGGYTGAGNPNEVAGVVHRGEYVLPQDMVDQTTGTPKALGSTFNIYVEGVFATSAQERRRVADQIVQAINQNNKSRLEASWQ